MSSARFNNFEPITCKKSVFLRSCVVICPYLSNSPLALHRFFNTVASSLNRWTWHHLGLAENLRLSLLSGYTDTIQSFQPFDPHLLGGCLLVSGTPFHSMMFSPFNWGAICWEKPIKSGAACGLLSHCHLGDLS